MAAVDPTGVPLAHYRQHRAGVRLTCRDWGSKAKDSREPYRAWLLAAAITALTTGLALSVAVRSQSWFGG